MIGYRLVNATMSLDESTTEALDEIHDARDRCAVEREIAAEAERLATSLGRRVTVETSNGIELGRFGR